MELADASSSDEETDYTTLEVADRPYSHPSAVYGLLKYIEKAIVLRNIFYRSDLETLLPRGWLNDKVINTYMEILASHHKDTYFFSTFIYPHLKAKPITEAAEWFSGLDLERYKSFVFPIHTSSHWALVIVQNNEILGFDSLGAMTLECLATIRRFMLEVFSSQKKSFGPASERLMDGKIPQQTNGDDCGVFCCAYARYYINETVYNQFSSSDIPSIRAKILHEILVGKVIYI